MGVATGGTGLRVRVVGRGRAGGSFAAALAAAGWQVDHVPGRGAPLAADDVDVVLVCVPDGAVAEVAARISPGRAVVAHVAGSLRLDVLGGHPRVASVHPLVALADAQRGAAALGGGATFAVAGDDVSRRIVADLGGRAIEVPDEARAGYHAAAVIASNHLVGLLGQVERVAAGAGVPLDAYLDLIQGTVDNVAALGPARALTGPAARGDVATIEAHLAAIDPAERDAYRAGAELCRRLVTGTAAPEPRPERGPDHP